MSEFKSIKIKIKLGSAPDDTSWWTEKDWEENRKAVERLKESGDFGKEKEYTIHYKPHPLFDPPVPKENYKSMSYFVPIGKSDIQPSANYNKELLEKYSMWLTKNGYMDTDWKDEEPFAIDEFLKTLK